MQRLQRRGGRAADVRTSAGRDARLAGVATIVLALVVAVALREDARLIAGVALLLVAIGALSLRDRVRVGCSDLRVLRSLHGISFGRRDNGSAHG